MYELLSVSSSLRQDGNVVGMSWLKCAVAWQNVRAGSFFVFRAFSIDEQRPTINEYGLPVMLSVSETSH